jgi:hypothetical protein
MSIFSLASGQVRDLGPQSVESGNQWAALP